MSIVAFRLSPVVVAGLAGLAMLTTIPPATAQESESDISVVEPNIERAEKLMGFCERSYQGGKPDHAIEICLRVVRLEPKDPDVLARLGKMMLALGSLEEAVATYQQLLEITPRNAATRYGLGEAYAAMGRYDLARDAFKRALAVDRRNPRIYSALGVSADMLGRPKEAQSHYSAGLGIDPTNGLLKHNLEQSLAHSLAADPETKVPLYADASPQGLRLRATSSSPGFNKLADEVEALALDGRLAVADVGGSPVRNPHGESVPGAPRNLMARSMPPPHNEGAPRRLAPRRQADKSPAQSKAAMSDMKPQGHLNQPAAQDFEADPEMMKALESGAFAIRFGHYESQSMAWKGLTATRSAAADLLSGVNLKIRKSAEIEDVGSFEDSAKIYELRTDPFDGRAAADKLCRKLQARQIECHVIEAAAAVGAPVNS